MPFRISDLLLRLAPYLTMGLVVAGLTANLMAEPQADRPALAVPTALAYVLLALLLRQNIAHSDRQPHPRLTRTLAAGLALAAVLTLADRWTGALDGRLDALLRAAELGHLGVNGHVSTKSLLFVGAGALSLLATRENRLLSSLFVLALLGICNVAVVDLAMKGALWDQDLSVWSTLAAFTLTLAATLRLRERSIFSALFLPGAAGNALRLMALLAFALPMAAGWIYAYFQAPSPKEATLIAQLFGGLGWVMFQMTFLLGYVIARDLRRVETARRRDALTGLLNQTGLAEAVRHLKADIAGVMICEIDGFHALNDRLGHPAGDALLHDVARTIERVIPPDQGILGRLWSDVFLIVVPNLAQPELSEKAAAVQNAVATLPPLPNETGPPRLSVGCTTYIPATMPVDTLFDDADKALQWVMAARGDLAAEPDLSPDPDPAPDPDPSPGRRATDAPDIARGNGRPVAATAEPLREVEQAALAPRLSAAGRKEGR